MIKNNLTDKNGTDLLEGYYSERPLTETELRELSGNLDKKIKSSKRSIYKILSHLKALKRYMTAKDVKWYRKSIVVAAVIYFITPIDAMPDFAPFIGFLDDFGVIAWTIRFLGSEITEYYD